MIPFGQRPEYGWLQGLVRLMAHEIEQQNAGAQAIVAQLSGTLFTLAVRACLDTRPELSGVLGLMASPRLAGALKAMLDAPQHDWTVRLTTNQEGRGSNPLWRANSGPMVQWTSTGGFYPPDRGPIPRRLASVS